MKKKKPKSKNKKTNQPTKTKQNLKPPWPYTDEGNDLISVSSMDSLNSNKKELA